MALKTNKISKDIAIWLAELTAIFLGAYLAFLLNGHRIQNQNEHKKQQIYTALYRQFSLIHQNSKYHRKAIKSTITPFLSAYRKGKMPRLKKFPFLTLTLSANTWNAMLQAGGINLLSVQLIQRISNFWNIVRRLKQRTIHFNKMTDRYLIPNLSADISEFYNMETKNIRPKYEWYVKYLRQYRKFKDKLEEKSQEILRILRKKMSKKQLQKVKADLPG